MYDEMNIDALYCMLKGEPGTRKSTQALSFPKPQYWFSHDKKMRALGIPMMDWKINPSDIVFDDYTDYNAMQLKLNQFKLNCPYKTIVIDSITSNVDSILDQTKYLKKGQIRQSGATAGINIAGIQINEMEDYNAEDSALREVITFTKDIHSYHKVNIILIAHVIVASYKDNKTNQTHISRTIVTAGKRIAAKIPAYCDEVYHFNIKSAIDVNKEGTYECLTRHTGDDFARTTLPLSTSIEFGNEPLYERWIKPAIEKQKQQLQQFKEQQQPKSQQIGVK